MVYYIIFGFKELKDDSENKLLVITTTSYRYID